MSLEGSQTETNDSLTYDGMQAYLSHFGIDHNKLIPSDTSDNQSSPSEWTKIQQKKVKTMEKMCETLKCQTAGIKIEASSRKDMRMVVLLERVEPISDALLVKTEDEAETKNFCRCCFKSMNPIEVQFEATASSLEAFEEVTQVPSFHYHVAPTFCEACFQAIQSFVDFKRRAIKKQQRFEALVLCDNSSTEKIFIENIKTEPFDEDFIDQHDSLSDAQENKKMPSRKPRKRKSAQNSAQLSRGHQKCPKCRKSYFNLPRHLLKSHPLQCKSCSFKTSSQNHLERHTNKVHSTSQTCHLCFKIVENKFKLLRHMRRSHCPKIPHTCDLCGHTSFSKSHLKNHMHNRHSTVATVRAQCSICSMIISAANLSSHIARVHQKIKRFACDQCGKMFFGKNDVKSHIDNMHAEVKPFVCEVCGKFLPSASILRAHLKSKHYEDAEASCDICSRKFKGIYQLKRHKEVVHMNVKNYACSLCDRMFRGASDVRDHQLNHIGIKFACYYPGCSTSTNRKDGLIVHLKMCHSLSNDEMTEYRARIEQFYRESLKRLESGK